MAADFVTKQDANWDLERGAFNILIDRPASRSRVAQTT